MAKRPEKPVCSVEQCDRPARCRGWCDKHYYRWATHGDPTGGRTPDGAPSKFILEALSSDTEDCIPWPFSVASGGYGSYYANGRSTTAHREICDRAHGKKPTPLHEVAHGCGNRLCVNPRHLRWATRKENHADKHAHGTAQRGENHPNAKITEQQVLEIRNSLLSLGELAASFGVTKTTISYIRRGKSWSHVS